MDLTNEQKKWVKDSIERNLNGMNQCRTMVSIWSGDCARDPLMVLQMGLAVMLDKPIAILCVKNTPIPENIRKLAFAIEFVDKVEDSKDAILRIMDKVKELGIVKD